jgi:hypothetical protein
MTCIHHVIVANILSAPFDASGPAGIMASVSSECGGNYAAAQRKRKRLLEPAVR